MTALLVGVALAVACARTVGGIRTLVAEQAEARAAGQRTTVPAFLFLAVAVTGVPAALLIAFALVPTRWLHAVDPSPSRVGSTDVADAVSRSFLP